jgi:predicted ArsR family transcriptional regulator
MSSERKEQGTTRQSILHLLRRNGQMTALEMSEALSIGAVGVRQHLALLERDGLVRVEGLRRGIGRPSHLYVLTDSAEHFFPKNYDELVLEVMGYVEARGGHAAVDEVFQQRRKRHASDMFTQLHGRDLADRVTELACVLTEQGYMCEWCKQADGSYLLTEHNCPVDCVARRYPDICRHELALYRELLGVEVTREQTISDGDFCCRYHIAAN